MNRIALGGPVLACVGLLTLALALAGRPSTTTGRRPFSPSTQPDRGNSHAVPSDFARPSEANRNPTGAEPRGSDVEADDPNVAAARVPVGPDPADSPAVDRSVVPGSAAGDLLTAYLRADFRALHRRLSQTPATPADAEGLMGLFDAESDGTALRQEAARGLVQIGTQEAVRFVLDRAVGAQTAGDSDLALALFQSLESLTSPEGAQPLFEVLLQYSDSEETRAALPVEQLDGIRKALRNLATDEAVGATAADLYLELQSTGRDSAVRELFNNLAEPNLLASLALRARQAGSQDHAEAFLERIGQLANPAAVSALVKAGTTAPELFPAAARQLYAWSRDNPAESHPGLYVEYLSDASASPAQRILGAYGMAALTDTETARQALTKTAATEPNAEVRSALDALLASEALRGSP